MKTAYYKSTPEVCLALRSEFKNNKKRGDELYDELLERYGADLTSENRDYITGLAFECESKRDCPWTVKHGSRVGLKLSHQYYNDKCYAVYEPHMGRKIGKAIFEEFEVVNRERSANPKSLSRFLVKKFGLSRMILDGGASTMRGTPMRNSYGGTAENNKDILLLVVPYEEDWKEYGKSHKKPESIEGFTQIKKSEFVSLTEDDEL